MQGYKSARYYCFQGPISKAQFPRPNFQGPISKPQISKAQHPRFNLQVPNSKPLQSRDRDNLEFTFLTKPVKRRQFLHSVATEFSNCKMSFTPNLLQKLLFSPKPLVSLLGGCGGYPPNRTLPLFFTYFHYHCLKGGPGGLPLVNSLFLLLQSLYCFLLIAILIPRRGIRWVSPWVFRSSSHYKYQNHII